MVERSAIGGLSAAYTLAEDTVDRGEPPAPRGAGGSWLPALDSSLTSNQAALLFRLLLFRL